MGNITVCTCEKGKTKWGNFLNNVIVYIYDPNNRKSGTHIEITAFNINFQYLSTLTLKLEGVHCTPLWQECIRGNWMCDLTESLSIRLRAVNVKSGRKIKKYHLSGCQWQSFLPRCPPLWSRLYRHRLGLWPEPWRRGCWGRRPRKQTFDICKEELQFNKCGEVRVHTWKSMIETHTDRRYKSFTQSEASAGWLDLWLWLLLVTMI